MKSVFNTFLMISTNASRVTGDTFRFIEGWVQLGIFHQSTVDEFYSNFNLLEQQKCIDDRVRMQWFWEFVIILVSQPDVSLHFQT